MIRLPIQHAFTLPPRSPPEHFHHPPTEREPPVARHQHATENIHDLDAEAQKALSALLDGEQYRLDIIFEKDARDGALADLI